MGRATLNPKTQFNLWYWVAAFAIVLLFQYFFVEAQQVATLTYTEFGQQLRAGQVSEAAVSDRFIQGVLKDPLPG